MPPLLNVKDLRAGYGPIDVLHGVSLVVEPGEIVTLIGANGAGKSTTLLCLSGLVKARDGSIEFAGERIDHRSPHRVVRDGLCQSPEGRQIFPRLTVLENLKMGAYARRDKRAVAADQERCYGLFPLLGKRANQPGGTLSGGEQQMLALARALMSRPKLLMLDEPSLGLAPLVVRQIFQVIAQLNAEGMAILLVEQNARMALSCARRGYVMEAGRVIASGSGADLLEDHRVKQAYLGE